MKEIIFGSIFILISIGALIISILSFKEKGYLLNNAYIYATKQERENMDKKPYYRQSAIVFLMISIIFLFIGIAMLLSAVWMIYIAMAIAALMLVYAVASGIAAERQKKQ